MNATVDALREELKDREYSEVYAESFLDSFLATQIKVLREQNGWTQKILAERIGTKQGAISRIEDVNYSKWNVSTLKKLAREFRVRLKVSFETYGSLLAEVDDFSRPRLEREPREKDSILYSIPAPQVEHSVPSNLLMTCPRHRHVFVSHSSQNRPGVLLEALFGQASPWHLHIAPNYPLQVPIVSATDAIRKAATF